MPSTSFQVQRGIVAAPDIQDVCPPRSTTITPERLNHVLCAARRRGSVQRILDPLSFTVRPSGAWISQTQGSFLWFERVVWHGCQPVCELRTAGAPWLLHRSDQRTLR
jgi:hypothetical protein